MRMTTERLTAKERDALDRSVLAAVTRRSARKEVIPRYEVYTDSRSPFHRWADLSKKGKHLHFYMGDRHDLLLFRLTGLIDSSLGRLVKQGKIATVLGYSLRGEGINYFDPRYMEDGYWVSPKNKPNPKKAPERTPEVTAQDVYFEEWLGYVRKELNAYLSRVAPNEPRFGGKTDEKKAFNAYSSGRCSNVDFEEEWLALRGLL